MKTFFSVLRVILLVFFLGLFCYSGWQLWEIYQVYQTGSDLYADVAAQVVHMETDTREDDEVTAGESEPAASGASAPETADIGITVDFDALLEINPDVVGWLYCPNTVINYPLVQGEDNDYYLHRLIDGTSNSNGTLFVDAQNSAGFSDENTVIYGHHMRNGSMFGSLENYEQQSYYEAHPVVYLLTPEGNYAIELFAGFTIAADAPVYTYTFATEDDYASWLAEQRTLSDFTASVEAGTGDRVVTLSTCAYDFQDARYVVLGKLVSLTVG